MGTRSRIAIKDGDTFKSVYCHWDGYIEYNGRMLHEHYGRFKAEALIGLGDISSLKPEIGEKHLFSAAEASIPEDVYEAMDADGEWTTFYGRDRGDEYCSAKLAYTFKEFLEQCNCCNAEYYYVMENSKWFVGSTNSEFKGRLVLLEDVLEDLSETESI